MMARTGTRTTPLWALYMGGLPFATRAMVGNACQRVPNPQIPVHKGSRPRRGRSPSAFSAPSNENLTPGGRSIAGHYKRPDAPPALTAAWRKEAFIAEGVS